MGKKKKIDGRVFGEKIFIPKFTALPGIKRSKNAVILKGINVVIVELSRKDRQIRKTLLFARNAAVMRSG